MVASDTDDTVERPDRRRDVSRYDFVLAVIPTAFLIAAVASQVLPVSGHALLVAASAVGTLALLDGLFVNPPRSGSGTA